MLKHQELLDEISRLPANWHGSGSMSQKILKAILFYAEQLDQINYTAETGAGKTTLLFSNISKKHIVFALDNRGSLSAAKSSSILLKDNIEFNEGPTQKTLPNYSFNEKFDIVLLDGPHGYPFPDLEYFYFYPHIKTGGLLLMDDICIPTITRMYEILKNDKMWKFVDMVENLAIFKRTDSPLIDPYTDSWWLQGYNKSFNDRSIMKNKIKNFIPKPLLSIVPIFIKRGIMTLFKL